MSKKLHTDELSIYIPQDVATLSLPDPNLLLFYKNAEDRILWIDTEICDATLENMKMIINWNKEDKTNNIPIENRKPIKIYINSVGGDLDCTNSMISIIKLSKTPVWTINAGIAMSGGAFIFLAGHRRLAFSRSTFLLHSGSCDGLAGTAQQIEDFAANYKKQVSELKDYLVNDCGLDKALVQRKMRSEWFFDAKQAVEIGVADSIITDIDDII